MTVLDYPKEILGVDNALPDTGHHEKPLKPSNRWVLAGKCGALVAVWHIAGPTFPDLPNVLVKLTRIP